MWGAEGQTQGPLHLPDTLMETDGVLGHQLQSKQDVAVAAIWRGTQQIEDSLSLTHFKLIFKNQSSPSFLCTYPAYITVVPNYRLENTLFQEPSHWRKVRWVVLG